MVSRILTLATFHPERSELKTQACRNTAEVSKRERESRRRTKGKSDVSESILSKFLERKINIKKFEQREREEEKESRLWRGS